MGSVAGCHSVHSQATENGDVLSSESDSSQGEGVCTEEEDNAEAGKSEIETLSDKQEVSNGEAQECPHTQDTLTGVSQLFREYEDTDPESNSGESPDHMAKVAQGQPQVGQPQERLQQVVVLRGRAANR